ncbi:phospholipase effector Tle1 domain-containing protein [Stutzerimonas stutzeri]|uniref:phospholipase effector Tle1 domain-containing protein n=1 Tax=Stutzerimonas stutzeri TaxID=316 RepID=UPI003720F97E
MARYAMGAIGVLLLLTTGCQVLTAPIPLQDPPPQLADLGSSSEPKKIALFFDGTSNDQASETNIWRLYEIVQKGGHATTFYIEGVGTKKKAIGMATAWGIDTRVQAAYQFLLERYRHGDEIYVFGFSRGAYSARILASMLYYAGLPSLSERARQQEANEITSAVYTAYKCSTWSGDAHCASIKSFQRADNITDALRHFDLEVGKPVQVQFLGLWDTVEALGWPDYEQNVDVPNPRYGDQLCNVKKAAHALSLDDNRARIFTPILLTRKHLLADCGRSPDEQELKENWARVLNERVEEVYFAGAHADVGGGYTDAANKLSGVSLAWMMDRSVEAGLPIDQAVLDHQKLKQDPTACTHDAEAELPYGALYKRQYRDIFAYAASGESSSALIKFHACLIKHIETRPRTIAEFGGGDPEAQSLLRRMSTQDYFNDCFEFSDGKYGWRRKESCVVKVTGSCPTGESRIEDCNDRTAR